MIHTQWNVPDAGACVGFGAYFAAFTIYKSQASEREKKSNLLHKALSRGEIKNAFRFFSERTSFAEFLARDNRPDAKTK